MMETNKRLMLGNLVKYRKTETCKIVNIADDVVCLRKCSDGFMTYARYDDIECIPLTDKFFLCNDYGISHPVRYKGGGRLVSHIVPMDGFGPAITKYTIDDINDLSFYENEIEYYITGIMIRTVDDFQNIMNICGLCEIADKIHM